MNGLRLRTVFIFGVAAMLGGVLLHTSQAVQNAETEVERLDAAVEEERESIRVLQAEWQYLNNPERLEALAKDYLELVAPAPEQMRDDIGPLPDIMPVYSEDDYNINVHREPQTISAGALEGESVVPAIKPAYMPPPQERQKPAPPVIERPQERESFDALLKRLQNDDGVVP